MQRRAPALGQRIYAPGSRRAFRIGGERSGLRCTRRVAASRPSAAADCGRFCLLSLLLPQSRGMVAMWCRAWRVSLHMCMLRLTAEFPGAPVHRTGDVVGAANGASASLLSRWWPPAARGAHYWCPGKQRSKPATVVDPPCSKYGGSTCSLPPFAAERCLLAPTFPPRISTPVSTDALACCLSAAVSPQDVTTVVGGAEKLPTAMFGAIPTSGARVCEVLACACAYGRFKRVLACTRSRAQSALSAAAVCAEVMCWELGGPKKLPTAMFAAMTKSGACGREALARTLVCRRFNGVLLLCRSSRAQSELFAALVCAQVMCYAFGSSE